MNRRMFLGAILAGALIARVVHADDAASFSGWARALYLGDLALRDSGVSLSDEEMQALFTPEIQALRDATRDRAPPPSAPDGPILDILLGWGALPNRKVELIAVTPDGNDGARVHLNVAGNPSRLELRGVFDPLQQTWRIDDIDYGGGPDRTLRARLARMQGWPKR